MSADKGDMAHGNGIKADEAIERLKAGNHRYATSCEYHGDIRRTRREDLAENGQHPFAVIISCSDSRVMPEIIFDAGLGELFVIRSAGNVVDGCTLGSIEYAVGHMGVNLVVVLGHTNCGAIAEAINGFHEGHSIEIINDIIEGIGHERDPTKASCLNIRNSVRLIKDDLGERLDMKVVGALYDIRSGTVDFDI